MLESNQVWAQQKSAWQRYGTSKCYKAGVMLTVIAMKCCMSWDSSGWGRCTAVDMRARVPYQMLGLLVQGTSCRLPTMQMHLHPELMYNEQSLLSKRASTEKKEMGVIERLYSSNLCKHYKSTEDEADRYERKMIVNRGRPCRRSRSQKRRTDRGVPETKTGKEMKAL